ncbi:hypothetical protein JCM8547_004632 [Rhodosporidiobolus lusitaniae]
MPTLVPRTSFLSDDERDAARAEAAAPARVPKFVVRLDPFARATFESTKLGDNRTIASTYRPEIVEEILHLVVVRIEGFLQALWGRRACLPYLEWRLRVAQGCPINPEETSRQPLDWMRFLHLELEPVNPACAASRNPALHRGLPTLNSVFTQGDPPLPVDTWVETAGGAGPQIYRDLWHRRGRPDRSTRPHRRSMSRLDRVVYEVAPWVQTNTRDEWRDFTKPVSRDPTGDGKENGEFSTMSRIAVVFREP